MPYLEPEWTRRVPRAKPGPRCQLQSSNNNWACKREANHHVMSSGSNYHVKVKLTAADCALSLSLSPILLGATRIPPYTGKQSPASSIISMAKREGSGLGQASSRQ